MVGVLGAVAVGLRARTTSLKSVRNGGIDEPHPSAESTSEGGET